NVSERTPPPSGLIGTGNRSASVAAAVRAASPISSRPPCAVVPNSYAAATSTPRPATQTGKIRAASLRGGAAVEVIRPLPGQLFDAVPGELTERGRDEHDEGHEDDQPGLPLQHSKPPRGTPDRGILSRARRAGIPRLGDLRVLCLMVRKGRLRRAVAARRRTAWRTRAPAAIPRPRSRRTG